MMQNGSSLCLSSRFYGFSQTLTCGRLLLGYIGNLIFKGVVESLYRKHAKSEGTDAIVCQRGGMMAFILFRWGWATGEKEIC